MIIEPKIRNFICTTAHPRGCAAAVRQHIESTLQHAPIVGGPKRVLVIGASAGYGLASRIVSCFGCGADTVGVIFDRPAKGKRTASSGWYNTAYFEHYARQHGRLAATINGDAFSKSTKDATLSLLRDTLGQVDCVIYSLAAPRRTDPHNGQVYHSVLKPIGTAVRSKTVDILTGSVSEIELAPATAEEITATVKVMGGEDWADWIEALLHAELLAPQALTLAYSYVGPAITHPIYRAGTIGSAKQHLEQTGRSLDQQLQQQLGGRALVSINKALITQAASAIPIIPLYLSLLYPVMKAQHCHENTLQQMLRLFTQKLYGSDEIITDSEQRIRLDDWELREAVQQAVAQRWTQATTDNLDQLADIDNYRREFHQLFGFQQDSIDYQQAVPIDIPIASLATSDTQV